jgi:hypothetical protein
MKKKLKKVLLILGSILLFFLLVIVVAVLLFFYQKPLIKGIVEKQIEKRTGIHVTVRTLDYELFPLRIEAGTIEFATSMDETEVEVFIDKLALKGDIHRIRRKLLPYFEMIEVEGARIIVVVKTPTQKISIEEIFRRLTSNIRYATEISFKNSSAEFIYPQQKLALRGVDLALSSGDDHGSLAYTLHCRNAEGIGQSQSARVQNAIRGSGTLSLERNPIIEGRFVFSSNRFSLDSKEKYVEEINLNFSGKFDADKNEFNFSSVEIDIPFLLNATGPLDISFQDELAIAFHPRLRIDDAGRIFSLSADYLPRQLDGVELTGSALFEGSATIWPTHPERKASLDGQIKLNLTHIRYHTPKWHLDGHISGDFRVQGSPESLSLSGRARLEKCSFIGNTLEAHDVSMDIPLVFDSKKSTIGFTGLKGSAVTLSLAHSGIKLKADGPKFLGQGVIDLKKRSIRIHQARFEMAPFPPFFVEAQAGLLPRDSNTFSVRVSQIRFDSLMDFFSFAIPDNVSDWEPDGLLDVQLRASDAYHEKQKVWIVSAELAASGVDFHDPSFTIAGEALQPRLKLEEIILRPPFEEIPFKARLGLSKGESLWNEFYIDWSELPLECTISGRFQSSRGKVTNLSLGAAIPDFGRVHLEGWLELQEPRSADLRFTASELLLASLYSFIGQKRAAGRKGVELQGEAESTVGVKINDRTFSILGYIRVKGASWNGGDKNLSLQGIEAFLPLQYDSNREAKKDWVAVQDKGYFVFQKFRSPFLELSPLRIEISSTRNGYTFRPLELDLFGQKADVGEISVEYGLNPLNFKALTSLSWKDVNLSDLPLSSQAFRLEGSLTADLPLIEISPGHISTEGQAEVSAFGGRISIRNLQMEQPFSESRTVSCDVKFSGLDLEKITDSVPFGRVTGIIHGEIQDLAFSYGQPERFNILIESEKRKGIPQRFSLKATNDLAILGTGEKTPFSSHSGWTRFVKDFRYKKIGIACSLKNDIFSLRGTIKKKGIEYLVKGSGLFAINVVNKQVRNQIQFKDMLNRLKRIGQSK